MAKKNTFGSTKRFGSRYGHTLRNKLGKIEKTQKQKHECPYCAKNKVKFVSVGIWQCEKCNSKFTGKAYTPERRTEISSQKQEVVVRGKEEVVKSEEEE